MRFTSKKAIAMIVAVSMAGVSVFGLGDGGIAEARGEEKTAVSEKKAAAQAENLGVSFSKESGTYQDEFDLQLSCADSSAGIYYTTDGSDPSDADNEARMIYPAEGIRITDRKNDANVLSAIDPVLFDAANVKADSDRKNFVSTLEKPKDEDVDKCTVIKAAAEYSDGTVSEVVTNTYFVGDMAEHIEGIKESCEAAGMDLSVVSISMDADDLFDSTKGIYVKGDVFDKALEEYLKKNGSIPSWGSGAADACRSMDANYKQKGKAWERETHIDYFESNGTETACKLQQDCGIRIQGNYSRSDYQKGFRLYAREDYGKKNFKYGFWDSALDDSGNVIEKYKTIVLRNGGNCAFTTKFSDSYWQSLMKDLACETQSARPCVVYLNGEYWGVYVLQDDYRGAFMENKHGVEKDDVVIYKGDAEANKDLGYKLDEGELPEGVTDDSYYFQEMEDFMKTHEDLSREEDYNDFAKIVDVQSAIDYYAVETWINNKWDWPGKNWSMWKTTKVDSSNPYADGKWRFMIYDVEFGGVSGKDDIRANTIKNSNLLKVGSANQGDDNWDKPNVRCFALLMTNKGFREAFMQRLEELSTTMFEKENAIAVCNKYKDVYSPILDQFFQRFPTKWGDDQRTAEMAMNGHNGDTYGTQKNIITFLGGRSEYIPEITKYISNMFPEEEPEPQPTVLPEPTAANPAPTNTPAVVNKVNPGTVTVTLSDGAVKTVTVDENGNVLSTKYTINGVIYSLKKDNTLKYSVDNKKKLKNKTNLNIPDTEVVGGKLYKITEIETGAVSGLKKLKKVTVGTNVISIGKNAFKGCKNLKKVVIASKKLKTVGNNAIKGIHKKAVITCPSSKVKKYKKLFTAKTGYVKKTMKIKK